MENLISRGAGLRHYALRLAAIIAAVAVLLFVIWLLMRINANKYGAP